MNGELWRQCETRLREAHPDLTLVPLTPDARQVAVELP